MNAVIYLAAVVLAAPCVLLAAWVRTVARGADRPHARTGVESRAR